MVKQTTPPITHESQALSATELQCLTTLVTLGYEPFIRIDSVAAQAQVLTPKKTYAELPFQESVKAGYFEALQWLVNQPTAKGLQEWHQFRGETDNRTLAPALKFWKSPTTGDCSYIHFSGDETQKTIKLGIGEIPGQGVAISASALTWTDAQGAILKFAPQLEALIALPTNTAQNRLNVWKEPIYVRDFSRYN